MGELGRITHTLRSHNIREERGLDLDKGRVVNIAMMRGVWRVCTFSDAALIIGVSIVPGQIVFTRIPNRPKSRAMGRPIATTAPLEAP